MARKIHYSLKRVLLVTWPIYRIPVRWCPTSLGPEQKVSITILPSVDMSIDSRDKHPPMKGASSMMGQVVSKFGMLPQSGMGKLKNAPSKRVSVTHKKEKHSLTD